MQRQSYRLARGIWGALSQRTAAAETCSLPTLLLGLGSAAPAKSLATSRHQFWLTQFGRGASTQTPFAATQALLEAAQAAQFQERLEELQQQHACLPFTELVAECRDSLSTGTEEDAQRVCEALSHAGVVLRCGQLALLRPDDIKDVVNQVLPVNTELLQQRLGEAQAQLEPLEKSWAQLQRRLRLRSSLLQWGGLSVLLANFGLFFRLTYWELSWDVMEPIAFLATTFYSVLGYMWYMRTRVEFSYPDAQQHMESKWQERLCKKHKFDWGRYCTLRRRVQRYSEMLEAQQRLAQHSQQAQQQQQQQQQEGGALECGSKEKDS